MGKCATLELCYEGFCLFVGHIFQVPFAGTLVGLVGSTHIVGTAPEAQFQVGTRVGTLVVAQLVDILVGMAGLVGQADVEDILRIASAVGVFYILFACIVEYHMTSVILGIRKDHTALFYGGETDEGLQAGILHDNAVVVLSEFPQEVGPVLLDGTKHTLVLVIGVDGCQDGLIHAAVCCLIAQVGDDTVVAVLGEGIGYLAVQKNLIQRIGISPQGISQFQCGCIGIVGEVIYPVQDVVHISRYLLQDAEELLPGVYIGQLAESLTDIDGLAFSGIEYVCLVVDVDTVQHAVDLGLLRWLLERPYIGRLVGVAGHGIQV